MNKEVSPLPCIGFIVPAIDGEEALLTDCVANLLAQADRLPDIQARIVVCWQTADGARPMLPGDGRVSLLVLGRVGASAARNRGLESIENEVDGVMFVDVSVRPDAAFLASGWKALATSPMVSAPVRFGVPATAEHSPRTTRVWASFVVFRGFIWSSLFRADAVRGIRFAEDIGPGTVSAHQAGEDARFLYRVVTGLGLDRISYLADRPVHRLPRPDLGAKEWRYAFGQGYLVGQYLRYPTSDGRYYYLWRALLFLGRSTVLLMFGRQRRALGRRRIGAFLSGIGGRDANASLLSSHSNGTA